MVMRVSSEVEQSLNVTITYDDGTVKCKVISVGDYVSVAYNFNGARRIAVGTVSGIHANPASKQTSRKDWYFIVNNDDPEVGNYGTTKILVVNLIDVEILRMKNQVNPISSPNNSMRVTNMRIKAGYLQVSNNNGRSWKTVGADPLSDIDIPEHQDIHDKLHAMIGSDQYETSDDLIRGIEELIKEEAKKLSRCISIHEDTDQDNCECDQPWDCNCGYSASSPMYPGYDPATASTTPILGSIYEEG